MIGLRRAVLRCGQFIAAIVQFLILAFIIYHAPQRA